MSCTGPEWIVPMEAVRALACAQGTADLTQTALKQGLFRPHATVRLVEDRFVAVRVFEEPNYPGRAQNLPVVLVAVPQENRL